MDGKREAGNGNRERGSVPRGTLVRQSGLRKTPMTRLVEPGTGTVRRSAKPGSCRAIASALGRPGKEDSAGPEKGRAPRSSRRKPPTARVVANPKVCPPTSSIRASRTVTFERPRSRATWRRKAARLPRGSTSVTVRSGRAMASGSPGNPAPEPTSTTLSPSGIRSEARRASRAWSTSSSAVEVARQIDATSPAVELREIPRKGPGSIEAAPEPEGGRPALQNLFEPLRRKGIRRPARHGPRLSRRPPA